MGEACTLFDKGIDLVEKHFGWAIETLELSNRRDFYVGALALFRALVASGRVRVKLKLPKSHPLKRDDGDCSTCEMEQWLQSEVEVNCQAFNERNGNDWDTQVANQWLALA